MDFPDWRDDVGWNTHREGDRNKNKFRDNPHGGWNNWEGYNKNTAPFTQYNDVYYDVNLDGVMDGNTKGRNVTPRMNDKRLNWFRG